MRYQERSYIQNQNSSVRNRCFNNFNTSTDVCLFESPSFNVSGATKLDCSGSTSGATYIISANTETIPLIFNFTGNTQTFIDTNANFRYEIYKYNNDKLEFSAIPVYKSDIYVYSAFSATNTTTQLIPSSGITLDGEYLIKGYYQFSACTNILKLLGKKIDTINYKGGTEYGFYDKNLDYYFIGVKQAEKPNLIYTNSNSRPAGILYQLNLIPEATTTNIPKPTDANGPFIVTLNGLVLAKDYDYTVSGDVVTLASPTITSDIITFIYTTLGGPTLSTDNIDINSTIPSGTTSNQGNNLIYYNTDTNKYEVFTTIEPSESSNVILMINGVTLANNIDFYQSTTNKKRLILEGELLIGDMITIIYFPKTDVANGLNTNNPIVSWNIENLPQKNNGFFSLEVSTGNTFTNFYYSGYTGYNTLSTYYSDTFVATGSVGTTLYYRVKNEKNYETICGNYVTTISYSDIIPVTIQSNAINSY